MTKKQRGLFISFEGGEGTGKSTQARRLASWLEDRGHRVLLTREPGGTEFGKQLRELVLHKDFPHLSPRAELLLYAADRAQHVDQAIVPTLQSGGIVITDRYTHSSLVYQGMCRKLGVPQVNILNKFATNGLTPDLVFLLDLPVQEGRARAEARARAQKQTTLDRFEREPDKFHEQVRKGFMKLAREQKRIFRVISAAKEESVISNLIRQEVEKKMRRLGLWRSP